MEYIKHITGICGEPHLNLKTIILILLINFIILKVYKKTIKG